MAAQKDATKGAEDKDDKSSKADAQKSSTKSSKSAEPNSVCPRCRSETISELTHSPVKGVWTIYRCETCLYAWRSTEPETNTDPEQYPKAFRFSPKDIPNFGTMPVIPPLLSDSEDSDDDDKSKDAKGGDGKSKDDKSSGDKKK